MFSSTTLTYSLFRFSQVKIWYQNRRMYAFSFDFWCFTNKSRDSARHIWIAVATGRRSGAREMGKEARTETRPGIGRPKTSSTRAHRSGNESARVLPAAPPPPASRAGTRSTREGHTPIATSARNSSSSDNLRALLPNHLLHPLRKEIKLQIECDWQMEDDWTLLWYYLERQ